MLMSESEFIYLAGKGNPVAGCIGCKIYSYYPKWNITVGISDELGLFHKNKVVRIETEDGSYCILGVKIAMSLAEADKMIKGRGFKLTGAKDNLYSKGDLNIKFYDFNKDNKIDKILVYVVDKLPKDVVRQVAFRTLKSTLEIRPMFHRLKDLIRAHILLSWLALLLVLIVEVETGETWNTLRKEIDRIHLGYFSSKTAMSTKAPN